MVSKWIILFFWANLMLRMDNNPVEIADINKALAKGFIHYDPIHTVYTVTDAELSALCDDGGGVWKDLCIGSAGVGIPCLINAISLWPKVNVPPDISFFLNSLFCLLGLLLGIAFGISWHVTSRKNKALVHAIKNKPMYTLPQGSVS